MSDEREAAPAPARPPKQEAQPASTEIAEVAPGILRLQLPVDMPGLQHVNCYALEDADGFAVVDPGVPGKANWDNLQDRLAKAGIPLRRVHSVIVTHSHPDHFGGAGLLAEHAGAQVVASDRFRTFWDPHDGDEELEEAKPDQPLSLENLVKAMAGDTHDDDGNPLPASPFSRRTPWGGERPAIPADRRAEMRENLSDFVTWFRAPRPTVRLADEDVFRLAGREWFALYTPGHTDDHLCLWDPTEGVLLSGDHVLPTITPHISGLAEGDALALFMQSLDRVAALPGLSLALPAHGQPIADVPGRVAAIKEHHDDRLDQLHEINGRLGWATVEALSHEMFAPRSWGPMAESEAYAHAEHLRAQGRVTRREADGHLEYQAV
jgi:glyoxylase-like metal-dependent hydrolase (beta-lactamase superfamily II)